MTAALWAVGPTPWINYKKKKTIVVEINHEGKNSNIQSNDAIIFNTTTFSVRVSSISGYVCKVNINQSFVFVLFTLHKPRTPSCRYTSWKQPINDRFPSIPVTCIRTFTTSVGLAIALDIAPATAAHTTFISTKSSVPHFSVADRLSE